MKRKRLIIAAAAAAAVAVSPLAASAMTTPRPASVASVVSPTSDAIAAGEAVSVTGLLTSDADLGLADVENASNCHAGWRTVHASITYDDVTGAPAWTWWHYVTFHYTCTKVDIVEHSSGATIYNPIYSFGGYLANTVTGVGQATVHVEAQGRIGICTHVVVDGCFMERDPGIMWVLTATGGAKAFQQDG